MESSDQRLMNEAADGLWALTTDLQHEFNLEHGVAAIVVLEVMAEVLRFKAPMEFDAYFDVLREELPKGRFADADRLDRVRHELVDILTLTTAG